MPLPHMDAPPGSSVGSAVPSATALHALLSPLRPTRRPIAWQYRDPILMQKGFPLTYELSQRRPAWVQAPSGSLEALTGADDLHSLYSIRPRISMGLGDELPQPMRAHGPRPYLSAYVRSPGHVQLGTHQPQSICLTHGTVLYSRLARPFRTPSDRLGRAGAPYRFPSGVKGVEERTEVGG